MGKLSKNILLLSTGDVNGAYESIYKLAYFLKDQGHTVCLVVKNKTRKDDFIVKYTAEQNKTIKKTFVIRLGFKIKNKIYRREKKAETIVFDENYCFMSKDETSENISVKNLIAQINFTPDFIITGMTDGFINSTDLLNLYKITKAEIFNVTVDMNHFTGGCHYAWNCKGYIDGCDEKCPAIIEGKKDLAQINFQTKLRNAQEGKFQIITGSGWTLKQAQESKIYKEQRVFHNINSFIDTSVFNVRNRDVAKKIFDFDDSKFYILAGSQNSNDPRKGFAYFIKALKILESKLSFEQKNKIVILVVSREVTEEFKSLNYAKHKIDYITDYRLLVLLYQAVDLFVNSSIEDSGPMMVSEAMACGTPVVGFDMGVVNNMVINDFNGYKAVLKDSDDLAFGIEKLFLLSKEEYKKYSLNSFKQIESYSSFNSASSIFNQIF